jgi:hypothetical protein
MKDNFFILKAPFVVLLVGKGIIKKTFTIIGKGFRKQIETFTD